MKIKFRSNPEKQQIKFQAISLKLEKLNRMKNRADFEAMGMYGKKRY